MDLNSYFDELNGANMELHAHQEICSYLTSKIDNIEHIIKKNIYKYWMDEISPDKCTGRYISPSSDHDEEFNTIIADIFTKNKDKPFTFFENIINEFLNSSSCKEVVIGKRDMFKTYLIILQNKLYESAGNRNTVDNLQQSLQSLMNEIDDSDGTIDDSDDTDDTDDTNDTDDTDYMERYG